MTTPPKAKKFRIRRPGTGPGAAEPQDQGERFDTLRGEAGAAPRPPAQPTAPQPRPAQPRMLNPMEQAALDGEEDGFPADGFRTAGNPGPAAGGTASADAEIDAIRREGLTGRQLRMARRVAQKHGLPATSDFDAVRLLRKAGVDPFHRANMLELVAGDPTPAPKGDGVQLPQTVPPKPANLPSTQVMDAASRARSIQEIQRDIAKRRRRKLTLLFTRLAFLVMLPTIIAAYYYYVVATPMYATKTEFVIQKADAGSSPALASLFAGSSLANSADSITVQSYLSSRDAMLRLDSDLGFKTHFSDPAIDPIQRLDSTYDEDAYKLYKRMVKIGYDPTEGIIKMEVIAASPELSAAFSEALIRYAEERVDQLTARLRADQMAGAEGSYADAERQMLEAQQDVLRLQEEMGVFDANTDASAIMGQINAFEMQLQEKTLQLQQLLANSRPNQARVDGVRGDIGRLETLIAELRSKLTEDGSTGSGESLAKVSGQLAIARTNLETRTLLMQQAVQQLEVARIEANKQTRYLSMGVHPVAPDRPTYPRAFENTLLAFFVFAGIYLMISITASILREQVSG